MRLSPPNFLDAPPGRSPSAQVTSLQSLPLHSLTAGPFTTLSKDFAQVRHTSFFTHAPIKTQLRIRTLLHSGLKLPVELPELEAHTCEHCGGELIFLRELPRPRGRHDKLPNSSYQKVIALRHNQRTSAPKTPK